MKEGSLRRPALTPSPENRLWVERNVRWLGKIFRILLLPKLRITVEGALPKEGPVLVLANHAHLLDPFVMILVAGRPIHFLAAESLWLQRFTALFCWLSGAIPRKKFVNDSLSLRQLRAWKQQGAAVGLFPEGERTWDGRPLPLVPGIEKLVRLVDAPVVCCRILNGHRHGPRWANKMRNGRIHVVFDPPRYFPKTTDPEEILAFINEKIRVDPRIGEDWPLGGGHLAEGLSNLLFACPTCGAFDRLVESGDAVRCGACGGGWRVDTRNRLFPLEGGQPVELDQATARLRALLEQRWAEEASQPPDKILLKSEKMTLLRTDGEVVQQAAQGQLCLSREALWVEEDGTERWRLSFADCTAVAIDLSRRLFYRTRDQRSFEVVLPKESVVKWCWISEHWRRAAEPPLADLLV